MADSINIYVIHRSPRDYPGKHVVRINRVFPGRVVVGPLVGVVDTLEEARGLVPAGLACLPRHPEDEPQIVESWL
jgi:hypothetical protein